MTQPKPSYRSLELLCRRRAAMTGHDDAKRELERMAGEYKQMADWQERNLEPKE